MLLLESFIFDRRIICSHSFVDFDKHMVESLAGIE